MGTDTRVAEAAHLGATEADLAGRAVFAWVLVSAAGQLLHDLAEGHDAGDATGELRAAVRLLDRLGWPDDESALTHLSADEAALVRVAARSQLALGLDPDRDARSRVARGPATAMPGRHGPVGGLLDALDRGPR